MATTTDFYSNNTGNFYTTASGTSYTTANLPSQVWYYYDNNGELVQSETAPSHTHDMPSHNHGNWRIEPPQQEHGISVNGEEIMKFGEDIQMRIEGEWVSMTETVRKLETMEVIVEKLYNMLSPWQKGKLNLDYHKLEEEEINKEDEFLDPDLFKV